MECSCIGLHYPYRIASIQHVQQPSEFIETHSSYLDPRGQWEQPTIGEDNVLHKRIKVEYKHTWSVSDSGASRLNKLSKGTSKSCNSSDRPLSSW